MINFRSQAKFWLMNFPSKLAPRLFVINVVPKVWNSLPYHVKSSEKSDTFKDLLKNCDGDLCYCNLCKQMIFIKFFHIQYYPFSLLLFCIGRFLLNIVYVTKLLKHITYKSVTKVSLENPSFFLKIQFT